MAERGLWPSAVTLLLPYAKNPPAPGEPLGQHRAGAHWEWAGSALGTVMVAPLERGRGGKAPAPILDAGNVIIQRQLEIGGLP